MFPVSRLNFWRFFPLENEGERCDSFLEADHGYTLVFKPFFTRKLRGTCGMNGTIEYVKSRYTGGHYAFKTGRSKKAFENPMDVNSSIPLLSTDTVADIGAYVGEFSLYAVKCGVKHIRSYEPTPDTFALLSRNSKPPMEIFNCAVTGAKVPFVTLHISGGIGVTNSIAKPGGKVARLKVPAVPYEEAVRGASVVKIDVEGAEYMYDIVQPSIRVLFLEFHPLVGKPWKAWVQRIRGKLERAGFKPVILPPFNSGFGLAGSWIREL